MKPQRRVLLSLNSCLDQKDKYRLVDRCMSSFGKAIDEYNSPMGRCCFVFRSLNPNLDEKIMESQLTNLIEGKYDHSCLVYVKITDMQKDEVK